MIVLIKGPIITLNYFLDQINRQLDDVVILDICDKDYKQTLS